MKRLFVGDLHGHYLALRGLMERAGFTDDDLLVTLGDHCDHFPQPRRNVFYLVNDLLDVKNHVAILGNHDQWFVDWLRTGRMNQDWFMQGGSETLSDYGMIGWNDPRQIPELHRRFFMDKLVSYYKDDHVVCVHGGLPAGTAQTIAQDGILSDDELGEVLWNRSMRLPFDYTEFLGERLLLVGHTEFVKGVTGPFIREGLINLDCRGSLWGLLMEEDGSWKLVETLIENEYDHPVESVLYSNEQVFFKNRQFE